MTELSPSPAPLESLPAGNPGPETKQFSRGPLVLLLVSLMLAAGAWPAWSRWTEYRREQYRRACDEASAAEDWERLKLISANWHQDDPDNGIPILLRAHAAVQLEEFAEAAEWLERVPLNDPKRPAALLQKVELQLGPLNDPLGAEQTCREVLRLEPLAGTAHQRLIFIYSMTLQRRKMVEAIHHAIQVRREPPEAFPYLVGQDWLVFSNGYIVNRRWLENHPNEEVFQVALASNLNETGNALSEIPARRPEMDKLRERYPENVEVLCYYLQQAVQDGEAETVAQLLNQASETARQDNRVWRAKGWLHQSQQQWGEAREAYETALQINPFDWQSQHQLGEVHRVLGNQTAAREYAELGSLGKTLQREIMEQKSAAEMPLELVLRIAAYLERCGDRASASVLRSRIG